MRDLVDEHRERMQRELMGYSKEVLIDALILKDNGGFPHYDPESSLVKFVQDISLEREINQRRETQKTLLARMVQLKETPGIPARKQFLDVSDRADKNFHEIERLTELRWPGSTGVKG